MNNQGNGHITARHHRRQPSSSPSVRRRPPSRFTQVTGTVVGALLLLVGSALVLSAGVWVIVMLWRMILA